MSNGDGAKEREVMRLVWRAMQLGAVAVIAVYLLDACWFYVRRINPTAGQASSSVHRVRLLAIADKGGKTEFTIDAVQPEEDIPCARALFTHAGQRPCWYVVRHAKDPIPM